MCKILVIKAPVEFIHSLLTYPCLIWSFDISSHNQDGRSVEIIGFQYLYDVKSCPCASELDQYGTKEKQPASHSNGRSHQYYPLD
jgi:hypothetical protein